MANIQVWVDMVMLTEVWLYICQTNSKK